MKTHPVPSPRRSDRSRRGTTLAVVMIIMALLAAFASAAFSFSSGNTVLVQRANSYTAATGVAEAALELVYARWREIADYNPGGATFKLTPNYTARTFVDSSANHLRIDVTRVTGEELGVPAEIFQLLGLPQRGTNQPLAVITLQTVDVYGRRYGNYDGDGRCTDDSAIRIHPQRPALPTDYPPPASPDYAFSADNVAANGLPGTNIIYEVKLRMPYTVRSSSGAQTAYVEMSRRFTKFYASTAQFAIFGQNNIELFPGSSMTVNGKVHTNSELYVGAVGSGTVLKFTDNVTYSGNYHPGDFLGYGAGYGRGTEQFASTPQRTDALPVGGIAPDALAPYDSSSNSNYNNNSLREIIERPVAKASAVGSDPSTTSRDDYYDLPSSGGNVSSKQNAIEEARVYNQAGLKILVSYNADGTVNTLTVRGGTPSGMADGASLAGNGTLMTGIRRALNNVVSTDTNGFKGASGGITGGGKRSNVNDLRESAGGGSTVGVTTLDVGVLRQAIIDAGYDFNGILYIADVTGGSARGTYNDATGDYETSGTDRKKHAIMLVNGNQLPNSNLPTTDQNRSFTVASDNAVYIKGDYNTGGSPTYYTDPATGRQIADVTTSIPSNSSTTGSTEASGYNRVTASIVADSVTVVSNRFNPAFATAPINDYLRNGVIDTVTGEEGYVVDRAGNPVLKRGAIPTSVNAAVVSGLASSDSGGNHNLVRFLENWRATSMNTTTEDGATYYNPVLGGDSSCPFSYLGSLIQLFRPKEFNGNWSNAWYNNPSRVFGFDQSFLDKPPDGTGVIKFYSRGTLLNNIRSPYRG